MNAFKESVIKCRGLAIRELEERYKGIEGESTIEQLKDVIIPEMETIIKLVENNNLPSKEKRYITSFALAFKVWGWDMKKPSLLYISLLKLNDEYKNL